MIEKLYILLCEIFEFHIQQDNIMLFSNKLKEDGTLNIWCIEDSVFSLKLRIIENNIVIVAIANQSGVKGLGTNVVDIIHDFAVEHNYNIVIENDESYGYWDKIVAKYNDDIIKIK